MLIEPIFRRMELIPENLLAHFAVRVVVKLLISMI
jgi:hypothetical protein